MSWAENKIWKILRFSASLHVELKALSLSRSKIINSSRRMIRWKCEGLFERDCLTSLFKNYVDFYVLMPWFYIYVYPISKQEIERYCIVINTFLNNFLIRLFSWINIHNVVLLFALIWIYLGCYFLEYSCYI